MRKVWRAVAASFRRAGRAGASYAEHKPDFWIILLTMVLVVIGLVMVYDSSYYIAQQSSAYDHDGAFFLKNQLQGLLAGLIAMFMTARIWKLPGKFKVDYHIWDALVPFLLLISLVLMLLVWVPGVGRSVNGAQRWIRFGPIDLQPSEPAKFAVIVYIAKIFSDREHQMDKFWRTVFPTTLVTGIFCVMLFVQPNISMLMTYIMILAIMLWAAGGRWAHLGILFVLGCIALYVAYLLKPHAFERLTIFLKPWSDPLGAGYQVLQSLYAVANGGFFGAGIGNSIQKYLYLPFRESDYIFAIFADEFGFVGCIVLFALYWLLIWRCLVIAIQAPDRFGQMLAMGITTMLAVQVLLNVAIVLGWMPPTGLPLPFISAGGTSLALFLAEIGVMLNISRVARIHK
ncbi:MAG: putative lipid II flippase FtsW [Clostridia bacterium]|nr:putative lipid II flippase FtsW [Clostridia bacterium]